MSCTPESLAAVVERYGGLTAGAHNDQSECCILEAVSVCDGVDWTDDPVVLDRPDVRPLNDAPWSSDEARTAGMLRLAPLIAAWPTWSEERRQAYVDRVVCRTIREVLPMALRAMGRQGDAQRCEGAGTPEEARAAADDTYTCYGNTGEAATSDALSALKAAALDRRDRYAEIAARAVAHVASAVHYCNGDSDAVLDRAIAIWADEVTP